MSAFGDFFGSGGAGSSLIDSGGQIGLGLVNNNGARIQGEYAVALKRLANDASLSEAQLGIEIKKLDAKRDADLALANDQKRADTLRLVAVIGGLILIVTIAVVLILKSNRTAEPRRTGKPH